MKTGAFHPDSGDRTESGEELHDLPVAGTDGQELLVARCCPVSLITAMWWVSVCVSIPAGMDSPLPRMPLAPWGSVPVCPETHFYSSAVGMTSDPDPGIDPGQAGTSGRHDRQL